MFRSAYEDLSAPPCVILRSVALTATGSKRGGQYHNPIPKQKSGFHFMTEPTRALRSKGCEEYFIQRPAVRFCTVGIVLNDEVCALSYRDPRLVLWLPIYQFFDYFIEALLVVDSLAAIFHEDVFELHPALFAGPFHPVAGLKPCRKIRDLDPWSQYRNQDFAKAPPCPEFEHYILRFKRFLCEYSNYYFRFLNLSSNGPLYFLTHHETVPWNACASNLLLN